MKRYILMILLSSSSYIAFTQTILATRTAAISFISQAPLETIEARTRSAASALNKESGEIEFSVLIKSFAFQKALMQEHFNENYLESDRFPKAQFKGRIDNISAVKFDQTGEYKVNIIGNLMLHGQVKNITTSALFQVKDEGVFATSEFTILLDDYKIDIPAIVKGKVANTVKINIQLKYETI